MSTHVMRTRKHAQAIGRALGASLGRALGAAFARLVCRILRHRELFLHNVQGRHDDQPHGVYRCCRCERVRLGGPL